MSTTAPDVNSGERAPPSEQGVLNLARNPHLVQEQPFAASTSTLAAPAAEQLDLETVLKVSEEISGEIVQEKFIDRLMRAAIEHAGAERGFLIVPEGDELQIAAEATTHGESVTVNLGGTHAAHSLPSSILEHVARTQKSVILQDASAQNSFSGDPYLGARTARSVLCLPLSNRGKLVGLLYLENNLAPRIFGPARIAVLKLLASQAAMSLENTRLYRDLAEREAYLADAQRLTHTGSWAFSPATGRVSYWSDEMFRIYEMDGCRGLPTYDDMARLLHPEDRDRTNEAVAKAFRDKAEMVLDYRNVMADGTVRHLQSIGHPVLDKTGAVVEYFGTLADVTERRCAEQRLLAQHRVARILAEATAMEEATPQILQAVCECMGWDVGVMWRIDREAEALRCAEMWRKPSVEAARLEAVTRARTFRLGSGLLGRVWANRTPAYISDAVHDPEFGARAEMSAAGLRAAFALPILLGSEVVSVIGFFSRDFWQPDPNLLDMMATIGSQIGQFGKRAKAEQALRQSEAYLAEAQRLTHTGSWAFNPVTGKVTYWSEEMFRIYGMDARNGPPTRDEQVQLTHPEDRARNLEAIEVALRDKAEFALDYRNMMANGTVRYLHSIGRPVLDSSGAVVEYVGTIVDVTEHKRAEQRLLAQYRVTRILADAATVAEATPKILQAMCECLGWDLGALWRIDPKARVLRCAEVWRTSAVEAAQFEVVTRGSTFHSGSGLPGRVWATGAPAYIPDIGRDLAFRRADIPARQVSRAAIAFPILLGCDVLGVIGFISREVSQPDQELLVVLANIGSQIGQFTKRTAAVDELQLRVSMLQNIPVAAWSVMSDGTPDIVNQLWYEYTGQTLEYVNAHPEAWMAALHPEDRERASRSYWDGIRSGLGFTMEARLLRARDWTYRWHLNRAVPVRDAEGNILRFVGTSTDVHDWRQAQEALRNTQAEFAHMTRVMTMGELTASIAHEVNQPLGAMVTSAAAGARWLATKPPQMDKARRALERIANDGKRAAEVIQRIRALMKRQAPRKEWLDINETILEVIALAQYQLRQSEILLETRLRHDLPHVRGDRVQLQQVLLNLIINAVEAMCGIKERPRELTIVSASDAPDTVSVEVRDSGTGLDPEHAPHLFEAFYTTKAEGLGIGLSISHSIVEAHGGSLSAAANAPYGTVFSFSLPVNEPAP